MARRGLFIAVDKTDGDVLTSGQSIYHYEDSAKRGIAQWVPKAKRADYVIVEITAATIQLLLDEKGGGINVMTLSKEQQYAIDVVAVVTSLFDEDSENYRYDLEDIDATAFFTGFSMAFGLTFNQLTGNDEDFIGGTHLANRLAFQYLQRNGREEAEGTS